MSDQTHYTNTCEDEQIVKYIVENNAYNRISGNRLWQEIIADSICSGKDDWISLKEYFHNIILLKIQGGTFPFLTEEHINTFVKNTAELEMSQESTNSIYYTLNSKLQNIESSNEGENSIFISATSEDQSRIESTEKKNLKPIVEDNEISYSGTSQNDSNFQIKLGYINDILDILESDEDKSNDENDSTKLKSKDNEANVNILELSDHEKEIRSGDNDEIIESSGEVNNKKKNNVEKSDDINNSPEIKLQESLPNVNILEHEKEIRSGDNDEIIESSGDVNNKKKNNVEKSHSINNSPELKLQESIPNVNILEQTDHEKEIGTDDNDEIIESSGEVNNKKKNNVEKSDNINNSPELKLQESLPNVNSLEHEKEIRSGDNDEIIESSGEENRNKNNVEKSDDINNSPKLKLQESLPNVNILEHEKEIRSSDNDEIIESSGEENRNKNDVEKSDDINNSAELKLQESLPNVNILEHEKEIRSGDNDEIIESSGEVNNKKKNDVEKSDDINNSAELKLQESLPNVNILEHEKEIRSGDNDEIIESSGEVNNKKKNDVEKSDDINNSAELKLQESLPNVNILEHEKEIRSDDNDEIIESSGEENNKKKNDVGKSDSINNSAELKLQESIPNVNILELSDHEIVSGDFDESIDLSGKENNIKSILIDSSDDDELDAAFAACTSQMLEDNVIFVSSTNSQMTNDSSQNNNNKSSTENDLSVNENDLIHLHKTNVNILEHEKEIGSGDYNEIIKSIDVENNKKKSNGEKSDIVNNSAELNLQESVTDVNILEQTDHVNNRESKEIEVQCGNKKPREEGDFDESIDLSGKENNIKPILNESSDDDELDAAFAACTSQMLEDNVIFVSTANSQMTNDSSQNNNNKSSTENDLSVNENDLIRLINLAENISQLTSAIPETIKCKEKFQISNSDSQDTKALRKSIENLKITDNEKPSENKNISKEYVSIISNDLVISSSGKVQYSSIEDIDTDQQVQHKKVPIYDFNNSKSKYEPLSLFNKSTSDSEKCKEKGKQIITNRNIIKKKSKKTTNSDLNITLNKCLAEIQSNSTGDSLNNDADSKNVFYSSASLRSDDTIFEIESCNSYAVKINKPNDIELNVSSECNCRTNVSLIVHPLLSASDVDTDIEYDTCSEEDCLIKKTKRKSKNHNYTRPCSDVIVISSDSDDLISTEQENQKRKRVHKNKSQIDTRKHKKQLVEVDNTFSGKYDYPTRQLKPITQQSNSKSNCCGKQKTLKRSDELYRNNENYNTRKKITSSLPVSDVRKHKKQSVEVGNTFSDKYVYPSRQFPPKVQQSNSKSNCCVKQNCLKRSDELYRNNENYNTRTEINSSVCVLVDSDEERSNFFIQAPNSNVYSSQAERFILKNKIYSKFSKFRCVVCNKLQLLGRSTDIKKFYIDCRDCKVTYKCTEDVYGKLKAKRCR